MRSRPSVRLSGFPSLARFSRSRHSGCAWPISISTNARTAKPGACASSALSSHRVPVRHHDCRSKRHPYRLRASASRPVPPPLALNSRVDLRVPVCHSRIRIDFANPHLRDTLCESDITAFCAFQPPRATSRTLQNPITVALNTAVQSNRFYPPCSRMTDKILYVSAH